MKATFYLPPECVFMPSVFTDANYIIDVFDLSGARVMMIDSRLVKWEIEPEVPVPPPTPTPTPSETELYKVVTQSRLNVRVEHSRSAEIRKRLQPGEEFALEKGAEFVEKNEEKNEELIWRKTYPDGYWVVTKFNGVVYAEEVDTSGRAG